MTYKLLGLLCVLAFVISVSLNFAVYGLPEGLFPAPRIGAVASHSAPGTTKCVSVGGLTDQKCNSPLINGKLSVRQVCDPSFRTGTIRPPTSYTNPLKIQKMKEYGLGTDTSLFELDHIQPLTNLGEPRDPENLWPQYWHLNVNGYDAGAKTKDALEVRVHKLLCSGKMTISEVNVCFGDWIACYRKVIGRLPNFKKTTGDQSLGAVD